MEIAMTRQERLGRYVLSTMRVATQEFFEPLQIRASPTKKTGKGSTRRPVTSRSLVATFVGVIALSLSLRTTSKVVHTDVGEFKHIELPDGSDLVLNTNTELRVRYTARRRQVDLAHGEVLIDVAKDEKRPFDVTARKILIRATGTRFSVRVPEVSVELVEVAVSKGSVQINPPEGAIYVAGTVMEMQGELIQTRRLSESHLEEKFAWTTGMLVFQGETVSAVIAEFNRYNARKLIVSDPTIANVRVGGSFKATAPETFAEALHRLENLDYYVDKDSAGNESILIVKPKRKPYRPGPR
jgi:transmembrane sensor